MGGCEQKLEFDEDDGLEVIELHGSVVCPHNSFAHSFSNSFDYKYFEEFR